MLVQRKKITPRAIILALVFIIALGGAFYLIYNNYIKVEEGVEILPSVLDKLKEKKAPIITDLGEEALRDPRLINLKNYGYFAFPEQHEGMALDRTTPFPPTEIQVVNTGLGQRLYIFWTNPSVGDFDYVRIYRSNTPNKLGEMIADNLKGVLSYEDRDVSNGTTYYYTVRTVNSEGQESVNTVQYSEAPTDVTPPSPPSNVSITNPGTGKSLEISWTNPAEEDFDYIRIYRSSTKGELGNLIFENLKTSSVEDRNITSGETYYYTLTSVDKSGNESLVSLTSPLKVGNPNPFEPF